MTLWEFGKWREGWVSANTTKKAEKAEAVSEEEFEELMAMEINEGEEASFDDFYNDEKARQ